MARWDKRCVEFAKVREYIEAGENDKILPALLDICKKYAEDEDWDFADDFDRLAEDIEVVADDALDDDDIDFYLNDFYDLCDAASVWLELD